MAIQPRFIWGQRLRKALALIESEPTTVGLHAAACELREAIRQAYANRDQNHNTASDQQTAHEAQCGDVENIYQEACRWLIGRVDEEEFRAYIGEYLRGVREMASQAQAKSMGEILLGEQTVRELLLIAQQWAAEPVPQENRSDRLEMALRRALNVKGMSAAQKQAFREFVQADAFGVKAKS